MIASYWNQIEEEDEFEDYLHFDEKKDPHENGLCSPLGCMECLGLSWSDFI